MIFSYHTVNLTSKAYYNVTKYTVIHIQTTFPYNLSGINLQFISLLNMIVQHGS